MAAFISGYVSLVLTALLTATELGIQPLIASAPNGRALYCPYGLNVTIPAMVIEHLLIFGIFEGFITALVVRYFYKNDPGLIYAIRKEKRNETQ